ncbi:MAG: hypothetical protein H6R15_419 [Proteobacteria bacterium]|nr:hypothetical protein [Pseudomonadota bacterium]
MMSTIMVTIVTVVTTARDEDREAGAQTKHGQRGKNGENNFFHDVSNMRGCDPNNAPGRWRTDPHL